ncbi:MAG: tripartite tricarboxylate transporter permease [Thermodesulfobacteriota bacterium]|nr:tripartite tricarboxylate transporter permease [Thermodesulfobacteriota bacterium]
MFDAFIDGLFLVLQWHAFFYLIFGVAIGFWVGLLPGIGGSSTMALMIPFIHTMSPVEAIAFLLGMHAAANNAGDITSILFGIPGEATSVAVMIDGHPMAKKGEAGRAMGASLSSSLAGGVIGAIFLALSIPLVRPLVLALGSPEMFMVIVLGITCISSLSSRGYRGLLLGLIAGGMGILCSMVGQDRQMGILRYTFNQPYLWNGFPIIPVVIGFFAIPEIIDLAVRGTSIAGDLPHGQLRKGVWEGVKDTLRNFGLLVRCSIIGIIVGILPGIGGGVSQWIGYAHARQSVKTIEEKDGFGKGDVRGVIGPGSATNSKEGAALIPTVAFGIPGSIGMAILLGAFLLKGIAPGPDMLRKELPLVFSMVWTIIVANILITVVCIFFVNHIAKLTHIRGNFIIPLIIPLCFLGAFAAKQHMGDLITVMIFGAVGYFMVRFDYPHPPFIVGFILGGIAESYLYISTTRYRAEWLYQPKVIFIFLLAVFVAFYPTIQEKRMLKKKKGQENEG